MRIICGKRKWVEGYSDTFCPSVHKKIERFKELRRNCFLEHSDGRSLERSVVLSTMW